MSATLPAGRRGTSAAADKKSIRLRFRSTRTKVLMVCETPFHHQEILTCVCLTGGANTVVTVWELGRKQFTVRQHLYGHTVWPPRPATKSSCPVLATGRPSPGTCRASHSSATCSGTWLHLWAINGDPLANVNTLVGHYRDRDPFAICPSAAAAKTGRALTAHRQWTQRLATAAGHQPNTKVNGAGRHWHQSGPIEVAVVSGKASVGPALICSLSTGGKIPATAVSVSFSPGARVVQSFFSLRRPCQQN